MRVTVTTVTRVGWDHSVGVPVAIPNVNTRDPTTCPPPSVPWRLGSRTMTSTSVKGSADGAGRSILLGSQVPTPRRREGGGRLGSGTLSLGGAGGRSSPRLSDRPGAL